MKLLVLDVEGTIFKTKIRLPGSDLDSTIWQGIAHALGEEAIRREVETHRKWTRGEYQNYLQWMRETIAIHQEMGLPQHVFDALIRSAEYSTNINLAISSARELGFEPVLVTGGFRELARRAQTELGIIHAFAACEYFFDAQGVISGFNLLPCDFEGKLDFIRLLLREYSLTDSDWVFVGDGANDVPIAQSAPFSIAYRGDRRLVRVTNTSIDDYSALARLLEIFHCCPN